MEDGKKARQAQVGIEDETQTIEQISLFIALISSYEI